MSGGWGARGRGKEAVSVQRSTENVIASPDVLT
jgi:hypothetical protein